MSHNTKQFTRRDAVAAGGGQKKPFTGQRVGFTHTQNYACELKDIFPLLCPVREHEYLSRWSCDIVYLESGFIEPGGVFTTQFPQDGGGRDVWVVSRYEPNEMIQFVRVNGLRTVIYEIHASCPAPGRVRLDWSQTITGVTQAGNELVAGLRKADFRNLLADMERRLQYYLDRGEMMDEV